MCKSKECKCSPGRTPRFIQPCILLLLCRNKSYGYELIDNLKKGLVETDPDPGIVYRMLRKFERDALVVSEWIENDRGPAKRLYMITARGKKTLKDWFNMIDLKVKTLDNFIQAYKRQFPGKEK